MKPARTVYITHAELPRDDKTLRQAKSIAAYKYHGRKIGKAWWIDPMDKAQGVSVTLLDA